MKVLHTLTLYRAVPAAFQHLSLHTLEISELPQVAKNLERLLQLMAKLQQLKICRLSGEKTDITYTMLFRSLSDGQVALPRCSLPQLARLSIKCLPTCTNALLRAIEHPAWTHLDLDIGCKQQDAQAISHMLISTFERLDPAIRYWQTRSSIRWLLAFRNAQVQLILRGTASHLGAHDIHNASCLKITLMGDGWKYSLAALIRALQARGCEEIVFRSEGPELQDLDNAHKETGSSEFSLIYPEIKRLVLDFAFSGMTKRREGKLYMSRSAQLVRLCAHYRSKGQRLHVIGLQPETSPKVLKALLAEVESLEVCGKRITLEGLEKEEHKASVKG